MTQGAGRVWRTVAATVGACLLVTLVGWAALSGPSPVLTGPGPLISSTTTTTSEPPINEVDTTAERAARGTESGSLGSIILAVVGGALVVFAALVIAWLAYLLARRAWTAWQDRRRSDAPLSVDFAMLEAGEPARARRAMASDADEQLRLLLEGQPRNAIVACWHRFEVQAVEAGLARHPWETPSEFALRLLERAEVDAAAVSSLLQLYREARFSEHELDEDDRTAAAAALRMIQTQVARL